MGISLSPGTIKPFIAVVKVSSTRKGNVSGAERSLVIFHPGEVSHRESSPSTQAVPL